MLTEADFYPSTPAADGGMLGPLDEWDEQAYIRLHDSEFITAFMQRHIAIQIDLRLMNLMPC